jgi:hypothetical protein
MRKPKRFSKFLSHKWNFTILLLTVAFLICQIGEGVTANRKIALGENNAKTGCN